MSHSVLNSSAIQFHEWFDRTVLWRLVSIIYQQQSFGAGVRNIRNHTSNRHFLSLQSCSKQSCQSCSIMRTFHSLLVSFLLLSEMPVRYTVGIQLGFLSHYCSLFVVPPLVNQCTPPVLDTCKLVLLQLNHEKQRQLQIIVHVISQPQQLLLPHNNPSHSNLCLWSYLPLTPI